MPRISVTRWRNPSPWWPAVIISASGRRRSPGRDKEIWVGAGTHDIGFAKDKRNGNVTHKIDPKVDGERDNIGSSLQKASKVKSLSYYLPPNPVQDAKNATGDGYQSDGRLLVVILQ